MTSAALFRLEGCTAFISGAAGHLGRPMTRALCQAGAHVILNGRDDARLKDFEGTLKSEGFSCERAAFDVGDSGRVRAFFAERERLDVLVNNAISMTPKPFAALEPGDFAATYASAVTAAFEAARAALPALRKAVHAAGEARIVNIASMYAAVSPDKRIYARPEQASPFHYGPAKAALLQLTRHLAAELGPEQIRVNALVPGPFPQTASAPGRSPLLPSAWGRTPCSGGWARRGKSPAPCCSWRPASSYVTGASVAVDGGWTQW